MNSEQLIKKEEELKNYDKGDRIISSEALKAELEKEPLNSVRIKTGFNYLDSLIGEIEGGEMIAIGGLTKRGKSTWVKSMLTNLSNNGQRAVIFQYEIPYRKYFQGWGDKVPLFYLPKQLRDRTSKWIEERIWEAKVKYDINIAVIDPYNTLVSYEKRLSPTIQASAVVQSLKDICNTHNIIMFVTSDSKRMGADSSLDENIFRDTQMLANRADRSWIVDRVIDKHTKQFTTESKLIIALDRWEGSAMGKIVNFEFRDGLLYEKDIVDSEPPPEEHEEEGLPF